ncbi:AAA family ATPase [Paracoccus sanguinis]|uniref:Predicted ATPase n=1 Tax=Paracoccus sanguinis TaxID=1545044 RepID=A0A1H3BKD8_9RHOB|nr:AAA family ATPase [Paracoccus sanguinis]SDX42255.1 Predicted ATPase [Paracoccus sanguinis]
MITRVEIDGFKSFRRFAIDLEPLSAIVGPNASGKSNLFDAIQLIAGLATKDIRSAIFGMRGEPEELFRKRGAELDERIELAVELLLPPSGIDPFGTKYTVKAQRLRYSLVLSMRRGPSGVLEGLFIDSEECKPIKKSRDQSAFARGQAKFIKYGGNIRDFLVTEGTGDARVFKIRQDGPNKSGKPRVLPAKEASQTALSTVASAEFPHLFAVKDFFSRISFLVINARNARRESDRFQTKSMLPDASNISAVLARIKDDTSTTDRPDGVLVDISRGLARLIPSTRRVLSVTSVDKKEYSFEIEMADGATFSSRVISDGTLRLLALVTFLEDPNRAGLLCFEEPENGVHEGRIPALVESLREATKDVSSGYFQVLLNTHSPALMSALDDAEIIAADVVTMVSQGNKEKFTRMRAGAQAQVELIEPQKHLTRFEIERLLRARGDSA